MNITLIPQFSLWQPDTLPIELIIRTIIAHLGCDASRELAVVLSCDEQIRELNREFRGQDKPTNVLSFPSDEPDEWGDIILAYETIAREAETQGKTFEDHFKHMIVHGFLHLHGYDHIEDAQAEEMEALETVILNQLGVANPYENP